MDIKEILAAVKYFNGAFPKAAVEAAITEKDRIVPELLSILEHGIANIAAIKAGEGEFADYMAHEYAMFLLSQFGEKRAFPLIVRFFTALEDDPYLFTGDLITEYLYRFLYSTFSGDLETLADVVRNPHVDDFVRTAALRVPVMLYLDGGIEKQRLIDLFKSFMECEAVKENMEVITEIVYLASKAYLRELADTISALYAENLVNDREWPLPEVEEDFSQPEDRTTAYLKDNIHFDKISDTIAEMEHWHCFQGEAESFRGTRLNRPEIEEGAPRGLPERVATFTRTAPKIGRNDPCPCGSGKKYKKCCGG